MPSFNSKKCSSLHHPDYHGETTGVPRRPILRYAADTMGFVSSYLANGPKKLALTHAMDHAAVTPAIQTENLPELDIEQRDRLYLKFAKRASVRKRSKMDECDTTWSIINWHCAAFVSVFCECVVTS